MTLSTMKVEYMTAIEMVKKDIWLQGMLDNFVVCQKMINIHCNRRSAINLSRDHVHHARMKHIDVRSHFF